MKQKRKLEKFLKNIKIVSTAIGMSTILLLISNSLVAIASPSVQNVSKHSTVALETEKEEKKKVGLGTEKRGKEQEKNKTNGGWAEIIESVSWPVVVLLVFLILLFNRTAAMRVSEVFRTFKSVKLFAAEFVLTDEAKSSMEEIFATYRKQVKQHFDMWIQRKNLKESFHAVVDEDLYSFFEEKGVDRKQFRFTIHVPDLLVENTLYQLVDYYPKGKGAGRVKSVRFGIIGKAWRLQETRVQGQVSTDEEKLIGDWGMTKEEAAGAGSGRESFAAILLKNKSVPLGVFYMDSRGREAFRDGNIGQDFEAELISKIEESCKEKGVTKILTRLSEELRGHAPLLKLYD